MLCGVDLVMPTLLLCASILFFRKAGGVLRWVLLCSGILWFLRSVAWQIILVLQVGGYFAMSEIAGYRVWLLWPISFIASTTFALALVVLAGRMPKLKRQNKTAGPDSL